MEEKKGKRYFSREFKRDAVELVVKKGMSATKVARDLDIHPNLIHLWRRRYFDDGKDTLVGKGNMKPEDAELKRLKKELEDVKEERDILKKALSVFSKHDK
jgi:transposase